MNQYERYLEYLKSWVETHTASDEPNSPACFDEFCQNDDSALFTKEGEFSVQEILAEIGLELKRKGWNWVAMDESGNWYAYNEKPYLDFENYWLYDSGEFVSLDNFLPVDCKIKKATHWQNSLIELTIG